MRPRTQIAWSCIALSALAASLASAQTLNIEFGNATPVPPSSFGAAGTAGIWNLYTGGTLSGLLDVSGPVTSAAISDTGANFLGSNNDPLTLGNDEALLDDFIGIPFIETFTITGMAPGSYNVLVYTWTFSPLGAAVNVNNLGTQIIGGLWTGGYIQGQTYSLHNVTLAPSQNITIDVGTVNGAVGVVTGVQVIPVPTPGAATLLAAGCAGLLRRRR